MHIERLVEMVNDIAANQVADPAHADQMIADHLRKFWDPRMRDQILAHHRAGGEGLSLLGRAGVERLAAQGNTAQR